MLLTIRNAAECLRISPRTVRRLVAQGELPVIRLTKTVKGDRIDPADLEEFIERQRWRVAPISLGPGHGHLGRAPVDVEAELDRILGPQSADDLLQRRLAIRRRPRRA